MLESSLVISHSFHVFPYLPSKMSGRMTGWNFTRSRGCSISLTWWRNRMGTGKPEKHGPSYRCTLHLIPSETKNDILMIISFIWQWNLHIVSVIYSWRSHSFSKIWRFPLLSSMGTYGEEMCQSVKKAQSSLTQLPSMAIQSLSWALQECSEASTALFTLLTMKKFLKHQALQRETSFTNSSTIWITGTTLVVATGALQ